MLFWLQITGFVRWVFSKKAVYTTYKHLPGIFVQRIFLGQRHKNIIEHKKAHNTNTF